METLLGRREPVQIAATSGVNERDARLPSFIVIVTLVILRTHAAIPWESADHWKNETSEIVLWGVE